MEIEKVIRLLLVFLIVAAIGIRIATYILFPDSSSSFTMTTIPICVCIWLAWRGMQKKPDGHPNE